MIQEVAGRQGLKSGGHPRDRPARRAVEVTGDTVLTRRDTVIVARGGGKVVLTLVVDHNHRVAVTIVHAVQRRAERGHAQCQQEHVRGTAHQPRRQPQQFPHHCESNGHPPVDVKSGSKPLPHCYMPFGDRPE